MSQGVIQGIENLVSEQIEVAKQINILALKQHEAILGNGDFSSDDSSRMAALTSSIEVYESEKMAMLEKMGVSLSEVRDLSPSLNALLAELRVHVAQMRESVQKNAKALDLQIAKTRGMIQTIRLMGGVEGSAEYDRAGRVSKSSGGLLGAG